eukprot:145882-Rhodomonas_salina.1
MSVLPYAFARTGISTTIRVGAELTDQVPAGCCNPQRPTPSMLRRRHFCGGLHYFEMLSLSRSHRSTASLPSDAAAHVSVISPRVCSPP